MTKGLDLTRMPDCTFKLSLSLTTNTISKVNNETLEYKNKFFCK